MPGKVVGEAYHEHELAKRDRRIDELEAAIRAAIKHAEGNGMRDWKVFVALRKIIT